MSAYRNTVTLSNDFKKYYRSLPLAQYLKPDIACLKTRKRERERERERERNIIIYTNPK